MARKREEKASRNEHRTTRKAQAEATVRFPQQDFVSLKQQLSAMGLALKEIAGDGNCLFAALGDQLDGTPRTHLKHRQAVVHYMRNHRDDFEPFVEDNVPFDRHLLNMAEIGTYGGNGCIVAFARLNSVDVVIHQLNTAIWQIRCVEGKEARHQMHISYHNGDHYNSVRRIGDHSSSPPNIKLAIMNPDSSNTSKKKSDTCHDKAHYSIEKTQYSETTYGLPDDVDDGITDTEDDIMHRTQCRDLQLIRRTLDIHNYDTEAAVESIIDYIVHQHKGESQVTTPIWAPEGTGTRILGVGAAMSASACNGETSNKSIEAIQAKLKSQQHIPSSKRKELKKKLRKQQANDRKKSQATADSPDEDAACRDLGDFDVIVVEDMACLSI